MLVETCRYKPRKESDVNEPEKISLPCPTCQAAIYRPLSWFRRVYGTCPHCGAGLAAAQFAQLLDAIEREFDARIEELLGDRGCAGGCCGRDKIPPSPREVGDES
jgi:hypothetical protein